MSRVTQRRNWIVVSFLLVVAMLSAGVWRYGYLQALDQLERRAEADLALASDRLSAQLQVYQELAVLIADHPGLTRLSTDADISAANAMLLDVADKTGAMDVFFADRQGRVWVSALEEAGENVADTPYFRRAMQGALGASHGLFGERAARAYTYAAPAFGADGRVRGALVIVANINSVEQVWRGSNPAVYFTDTTGTVFISNRSELLFWTRPAGAIGLIPPDGSERAFSAARAGRHEIWRIDWSRYLPARALHLAKDLPVVGLTGEVLFDVSSARRLAALQAAAVAAICLAFGALLFLATERRRTLAEANQVLETRVAQRTQALSNANTQLRREIGERQEAEAALKQAQNDLVQAGKLSALGQMSAGISHELNQPLMAIGSFAENGIQFLNKGKQELTRDNLERIAGLARRMGRIISNLRAFARQESMQASRVDLVAVLDSVLEMSATRMTSESVVLNFQRPKGPVWVSGGEVRLGQVFLNLISNAMDAMQDCTERRIDVLITQDQEVRVEIRDTGTGLENPEKVFDPFYTTRQVGAANGMGLGLSISYGIVQSFGGDIRGRNLADGPGASFTVRLEPWVEEAAA
ncbi:MAG: ATP-binding protein [Arenibacterium sp.]